MNPESLSVIIVCALSPKLSGVECWMFQGVIWHFLENGKQTPSGTIVGEMGEREGGGE